MQLITQRLILRDWQVSDKKDLIENINDIDVTKWLLVVPFPYSEADADWWLGHCREQAGQRERASYNFAVQLKEGPVMGGIGIDQINRDQNKAGIGYWLGKKYHRQGFGSEALGKIIDFAFYDLKLRRLEAGVFAGNPSSGKLLEKFGFRNEGLKRKACVCRADGQAKDEYIYGLLKEEYGGRDGKRC